MIMILKSFESKFTRDRPSFDQRAEKREGVGWAFKKIEGGGGGGGVISMAAPRREEGDLKEKWDFSLSFFSSLSHTPPV